jgi:hypothetical protein
LDDADILAYSTYNVLNALHPSYGSLKMHFPFSSGGARFTPNDATIHEEHKDWQ